MTRKNEFAAIMEAINGLSAEVASIRTDVDALKGKSTKAVSTKKSTAKTAKTAKTTSAKKSTASKTAKVEKSVTTKITDFEPCTFKDSDNYVWGGVRGYKAMRSAYCYAKQTDGKARNLEEAHKLGIEIDFDKAWKKAKAEFEKKYVYVKASER